IFYTLFEDQTVQVEIRVTEEQVTEYVAREHVPASDLGCDANGHYLVVSAEEGRAIIGDELYAMIYEQVSLQLGGDIEAATTVWVIGSYDPHGGVECEPSLGGGQAA